MADDCANCGHAWVAHNVHWPKYKPSFCLHGGGMHVDKRCKCKQYEAPRQTLDAFLTEVKT